MLPSDASATALAAAIHAAMTQGATISLTITPGTAQAAAPARTTAAESADRQPGEEPLDYAERLANREIEAPSLDEWAVQLRPDISRRALGRAAAAGELRTQPRGYGRGHAAPCARPADMVAWLASQRLEVAA